MHARTHARTHALAQRSDAIKEGEGEATMEASLDQEWLMAVGDGVPAAVWGFQGHSPDAATTQANGLANEPFLAWLQALARAQCPPAVVSIRCGRRAGGRRYWFVTWEEVERAGRWAAGPGGGLAGVGPLRLKLLSR